MDGTQSFIYIYDGSFPGLMNAVYEAYYSRERVTGIAALHAQQGFDTAVRDIPTDWEHARKVMDALERKVSRASLETCYLAHLSETPECGWDVYKYIRLAFKHGADAENMMAHPDVLKLSKTARAVQYEAHRLKGFVRFHIRDGLAFSRIKPKYNVVELIAPHFAARYAEQPFIICDEGRGIAVLYRPYEYEIMQADAVVIPPPDEQETFYRGLWKEFFRATAVESRTNPRLQRGWMPKYFWKNLTEFEVK